ncbi:MAG: ABC transporter ATP-binding protein [Christensenellales bacterium]|jgi:ATP-binding cassette subfamily B multidrug efflux pump
MASVPKALPRRQSPQRGFGGGHSGAKAEKAQNFSATLSRLLRYLKPQLPALIIVLIIAVASTVIMVLSPRVLSKATNELQLGIMRGALDKDYIFSIIYLAMGLYLVSALLSFIAFFISASMSQRIVYRMRSELREKLASLPVSYYDTNSTGNILSRLTNDAETIASSLQQSLVQSITGLISMVGIIIMMFTISGWLTLVTLLTLPLYGVVTMIIARRSQTKFMTQQSKLGELNGYIEEIFSSSKIVRLFNKEKDSLARFSVVNDELNEAGEGAHFLSGLIMPMLRYISNIAYVGICMVGGILAGAQNPLLLGDIHAFLQYSNQLGQPIMQTANIANTIQSTIAAAERVFQVLDEPEEPIDSERPQSAERIRGRVEFKNVDFSYTPGKELIKDLSLKVESGQTIAIVGHTGAGKTTLVNLLMRFYEIDGGSIEIDGIDIREFTKRDLRSLFGMVLQDTWLESGTIRDNIAYGNPDATMEEIEDAARKAYADHFIRTLKDGYNTELGEEVTSISQGQKQLLTIARAIIKNPKILILDEATSSVDTMTESYIQNAMTDLMKGKTNFVIAHRLSTIRGASAIIVMDNGRIVEYGDHKTLMAKKGHYYDLYSSQFE